MGPLPRVQWVIYRDTGEKMESAGLYADSTPFMENRESNGDSKLNMHRDVQGCYLNRGSISKNTRESFVAL